MTESLLSLLESFPRQRVLVIGDAILDHYVVGSVHRTSPEAPVPVLHAERDEWLAGGAANVARNIAMQGAEVVFVSLCGTDEAGDRLLDILGREARIRLEVERQPDRPTPLKTRFVAQGQQILRVDRERTLAAPPRVVTRLLARVRRALSGVTGVVLSDYGKGLLVPELIAEVVALAHARGLEVLVDPKGTDYRRYRGADLITPNKKEAELASDIAIVDEASRTAAARAIQKQVGGKAVCITLGAGGVAVHPRKGRVTQVSARAREVFDVTGAGDTFLAVMALARFAGADFGQAAELGNTAAGIVVGRSGVAAVAREELQRELEGYAGVRKSVGWDEMLAVRRSLARSGRRVVLTNGCFDILNVHHIRLLAEARALGDVLVVALNSDESVRRLKGSPRPLLTATERIELIGSLPYVDYLIVFDEDTPRKLLEHLKPDILVKGANHVEGAVGHEIVEAYGGEVRMLETGLGPSTGDVIRRALEAAPTRSKRGGKP